MNLKDLTPKGIKINEAKMTPAKVQKAQKDLVTTIDALKKNFPLYKAAKESGDEKKLKKHRDIALKLTKKKKDLEIALDNALSGLYQDAELELKEADVFDQGAQSDTIEKDVAKLQKKFDGPMAPVIKLINTKDELVGAVDALINNVEQEKPGLGRKAKILLKKRMQEL